MANKSSMSIVSYIDRMNRLYGSSDEYGNVESATDRIRYPKEASDAQMANLKSKLDKDPNRLQPTKGKRMTATRSWQIIKESMDKDELEEWYKDHPEDRPIEVTPFKPDPYLNHVLGDDWLLEWKGGK